MDRREFLKFSLAALVSPLLLKFSFDELLESFFPLAWAESKPLLSLAVGGKLEERLTKALLPLGGIERFVRKGSRVILKPNVGWARKPEQAANTTPELLYHLTRLCLKAGAKSVYVYEHTCDHYQYAFKESGIEEAVEMAGGKMVSAHKASLYENIPIPQGKILKDCYVVRHILEADCFINLPVPKTHPAATLTIGMKNLMGIILDRGSWHMQGLHQSIADFYTRIKPHLTIVDATRLLLTNGPKGPGEVKIKNTLVAGIDPVAADSLAAGFFNLSPETIPYLKIAKQMGLGETDLKKIQVKISR